MKLYSIKVLLCAFIITYPLVAYSRQSQETDFEVRDALMASIQTAWPSSGGVHAVYVDPNNFWTRVGYEFSTGNWYYARSDPAQRLLCGRDDSGFYCSDPIGRELSEQPDWDAASSRLLDNYFPQVGLTQLLENTTIDVIIERLDDMNGWRCTFALPRGNRFPPEDNLPDAELQRWSTDGSILRPAVYELDADHFVHSFTFPLTPKRSQPKLRTLEYRTASNSPEGFQVVSEFGGFALTECSVSSRQQRKFDRAQVFESIVHWRLEDRERDRTLVLSSKYADEHPEFRPEPIEGTPRPSWTTAGAFVGAGVVLVLLGTGAWWKARQA